MGDLNALGRGGGGAGGTSPSGMAVPMLEAGRRMSPSLAKLVAVFAGIAAFALSIWIAPLYTGGDQYHYGNFYKEIPKLTLSGAYEYYRQALGSREPGYFIFVFVASRLVEKVFLFSVVNGLFFGLLVRWLLAWEVSLLVVASLFLNFYVLVLFFAAERLKVGLFFMLVGLFMQGFWRNCWIFLGIFSHVQTILMLAVGQAGRLRDLLLRAIRGRLSIESLSLLMIGLALVAVFFLLRGHIMGKIAFYMESGSGIVGFLRPFALLLLTFLYVKSRSGRLEVVLAYLPLLAAALVVGSDRITIFAYFLFLYYALPVRRGLTAPVLLSLLYFNWKGVQFLLSVFAYGNGFLN